MSTAHLVSYQSAAHGLIKGEILSVGNRFSTIRVTVAGNKFYRKGMTFMVPTNSANLNDR